MHDPHELRLTAAATAGDVAAFEQLYRRHCGMVHSLARRLFGGEDADDLTQDVFVRAWQKLATFRGEAPFGAWLRTLAHRLLASHWRRRATSGISTAASTGRPIAI